MRHAELDNSCDFLTRRVEEAAEAEPHERDRLLAKNFNAGLAISIVNGIALALFLLPKSEPILVFAWLFVIVATNVVRSVIARRIEKENERVSKNGFRWIVLMTAISGAFWGLSIFLILEPAARSEHFVIFIVAGMTAAACLSYATHMPIVFAFNFPALSVLFAFFAMQGGYAEYAMCAILVLYFGATLGIARRSGETVTRAIENKHLADIQRQEIEAKSHALNEEIEARRQSEQKLKQSLTQNRKYNEALDTLYASYILKDQSTDRLLAEATECLSRVLNVERVGVWRFSADRETLVCKDQFEASRRAHSSGEVLERSDHIAYFEALRQSRIISAPDAEADPRTSCFTSSYLRPSSIRSLLDAPLRSGRGLCGVICCESVGAKREWTEDDIDFVSAVAQFISVSFFSDEARSSAGKLTAALRDAERANEAKTAFLATMSHEIRTPMNGVLGATAMLQKQGLDKEVSNYIDVIQRCGTSLLSVINDILDVSKLEAGKLELEKAELSLEDILTAIRSIYNLKAEEKGLRFGVTLADGVADRRIGDAHRLMQILHNLVANAMKFTDKGSVDVEIADGDCTLNGEPAISIVVRDSGIGMSPEQTRHIFEPFVQADSSTTRKFGGSGLGLSIVKGIVDAMKGEISVHSEPNAGTTFHIQIPMPPADMSEIDDNKAADTRSIAWSDVSILVAEDNAINKMIMEAFLKQTGAQVTFVENGQLAVDAVRENKFDIVLMDIHMPEMDGVEAFTTIRESEGADCEQPLPIIAVTADAMQQERRRYLDIGFVGHIPKPVNEEVLLQAIEDILKANGRHTQAA